jgi:hypothetical protein
MVASGERYGYGFDHEGCPALNSINESMTLIIP